MEKSDNINQYVDQLKQIHKILLEFFKNDENQESDLEQVIKFLNDQKINENANDFKLFLHLISKISNDFHRYNGFFEKIEKILKTYQEDIQRNFSNMEIFNIFKANKRTLLFLFEEKIIIPNQEIFEIITGQKYIENFYPHYFYPEFKDFFDTELNQKITTLIGSIPPDLFEKNRKIGENYDEVYESIRKNSIDDFTSLIQKNNIPLTKEVEPTIFETNPFLLSHSPNLMEYATFFGSYEIVKYLYVNKVKVTPSLWIYSMHCDNPNMIMFLEQNHLKPYDVSYNECLLESIKCHNIDFTSYIHNNFMKSPPKKDINSQIYKYYNFTCFTGNYDNDQTFYDFCKYDYPHLVKFLLNTAKINLNYKKISSSIVFCINVISSFKFVMKFL